MIVQEYLNEPYLIEGLKFDLRVYVLVTSCDPLTVYVHREGLARFATQPYCPVQSKSSKSALKNMFIHLTNYSLNKENSNFIAPTCTSDTSAHKRTIASVFSSLQQSGVETE